MKVHTHRYPFRFSSRSIYQSAYCCLLFVTIARIRNSLVPFVDMLFINYCSRAPRLTKFFQVRVWSDRNVSYTQGQSPEPRIREYFYYIDHQGMLFLDDSRIKNFTSCFKDKKFLKFFFKRIRINDTDRYMPDFPYLSLCGRERNFIRCDDVPIVFTHVVKTRNQDLSENLFGYAHAGDLLTVPFAPDKLYMNPETGRVYHPAPEKAGSIGLVRSQLAVEFSKSFEFSNGEEDSPTHFTWDGIRYELNKEWYNDKAKLRKSNEKV